MDNQNYFDKAIKWAEKIKLSNIRANHEGFEQPIQFVRQKDEQSITPDITGKRMGSKFYIEIATKTDNMRRKVSKWKLLSTLANMKGGKLFLLTPRGHKAFIERIVDKHNLNAKLVYMPNI